MSYPSSGQSDFLQDARRQVLSLWDRNKIVCAWHVRKDFKPVTGDDFQRCLDLLMKHGDRDTYVLARKLKKCL